MKEIKKILIDRMGKMGIKPDVIPSFIRSLANSMIVNPNMSFSQLKEQLSYMGWDDFILDLYTYQLIIACFEKNDKIADNSRWFDHNFSLYDENTDIEHNNLKTVSV